MSLFIHYPIGGGGAGITAYANYASLPTGLADGTVAVTLDTDSLYVYNAGSMTWILVGAPGVPTSIGAFGSTPNAAGLSLAGNVLNMEPADATHPGGVSAGAQTVSGQKTIDTVLPTNIGLHIRGSNDPGSPIQPDSLSGLTCWLKADAITGYADGAPLDTWVDSYGSGTLTQSSAPAKPTYALSSTGGLPAVVFADNQYMTAAGVFGGLTAATLIVVYQTNTSGYVVVSTKDSDGWWRYIDGNSYNGLFRSVNEGGDSTGLPSGAPAAIIGIESSTTGYFYNVNGVRSSDFGASYSAGTFIRVGTPGGAVQGQHFEGPISEIIIFDRVLDATETAGVNHYLANKYTISLAGDSQTADLTRWEAPNGDTLAKVDATGNITGANLSGINTGDVTTGTANGLSLSSQALSLALADGSTTGALSDTDWNTFNSKQAALSFGDLTAAGTDGISVGTGTGAVIGSGTSIAQQASDASHNGYLSSADWSTFAAKQPAGSYVTLASPVTNGILLSGSALAASALATNASTALPLISGGTGVAPSWAVLSIAGGGTGAITKAAAFDALSPMTTGGDLIFGGASGTGTRLGNGSADAILTSAGGTSAPTWGNGVATATASKVAGRDANANLLANNFLSGYTTTATAAGTTTLVVGSTQQQYFTGTSTQTVVLPVTSTLVLGQTFTIVNLSTGVVTVNSSGSNLVQALAASSSATVTVILTSGTTAASWAVVYNTIPTGSAIAPTQQRFTSGTSQTYTTPSNPAPLYIRVRMVGGGGGGAGSGTAGGNDGGDGGTTSFGTSLLQAGGGSKGLGSQGAGGTGGSGSVTAPAYGTIIPGGGGGSTAGSGTGIFLVGANGGASAFGGEGRGGDSGGANAGVAGATNSGAGGGGAASPLSGVPGSGGGSGAFVDAIIASPSATYTYSVGTSGAAGTAGASGAAGGAGAAGYIEVTEFYAGNSTGGIPVSNQTANQVYAGPTSGGAAVPAFRALVSADIPTTLANASGYALHGTNTNDAASASYVGEYVESKQATAANCAASTNAFNGASISLTAGDWDVTLVMEYNINTATMTNGVYLSISTVSATLSGTFGVDAANGPNPTAVVDTYLCVPAVRQSLSSTTTIYLVGRADYSAGTPQYKCRISARRVR